MYSTKKKIIIINRNSKKLKIYRVSEKSTIYAWKIYLKIPVSIIRLNYFSLIETFFCYLTFKTRTETEY